MELSKCNWCLQNKPLLTGKPYCALCKTLAYQVCKRCKRPFDHCRYFQLSRIRCNACERAYLKERSKTKMSSTSKRVSNIPVSSVFHHISTDSESEEYSVKQKKYAPTSSEEEHQNKKKTPAKKTTKKVNVTYHNKTHTEVYTDSSDSGEEGHPKKKNTTKKGRPRKLPENELKELMDIVELVKKAGKQKGFKGKIGVVPMFTL